MSQTETLPKPAPLVDEAADLITQILRVRPHWDFARGEAARTYIKWAQQHADVRACWRSHVPQAQPRARVSAIICSIRPDYFAHIKAQLESRFAAHEIEVIGIHDAKSLCEGFNRGARQSRGDILIFCHDDIDIVHDNFADRLLHHLQTQDMVGIVGASHIVNGSWKYAGLPHLHGQIIHRPPDEKTLNAQQMGSFYYLAAGLQKPVMENIQTMDGVFMAAHRRVWESVGFDEATFDGFHLYDIDFSYRAFLAGYRLGIPADLLLVHFSLGRYDTAWHKYNRRFLEKFPKLSNLMNIERLANIHVKVKSLGEVELLHAALLHHRFGILSS
jgi:Glycosyltransferase like family